MRATPIFFADLLFLLDFYLNCTSSNDTVDFNPSTIMSIFSKMKTFLKLAAVTLSVFLIITGCGDRYAHLEFPNNQLNFPAEGGRQSFSYENEFLSSGPIIIDGTEGQYEPIYQEGIHVGCEVNGWLRLYEWEKTGDPLLTKVIEVLPNTSGKARTAEIQFYIEGPTIYDGKVFVHQAAQ